MPTASHGWIRTYLVPSQHALSNVWACPRDLHYALNEILYWRRLYAIEKRSFYKNRRGEINCICRTIIPLTMRISTWLYTVECYTWVGKKQLTGICFVARLMQYRCLSRVPCSPMRYPIVCDKDPIHRDCYEMERQAKTLGTCREIPPTT